MKKVFIKSILFILLISFFSCINNSSVKKNEVTSIEENKENFFIFFQDFCMNEEFQLQRIQFPLAEIYLSEDLNDKIESFIKKENWEYIELKKFDDNTFEYYFNSFTDREIKETNEKIYSILGIENGVNINYFFKIVNGKWYLVKIENLTT
tara:strand:- start:256 stop:708 length:453 start_codon:yes stop_codon:yes gene_type:complete